MVSAGVLAALVLTVPRACGREPAVTTPTGVVHAVTVPAAPAASRVTGVAVFGLVQPGERPGEVLFARARRQRPGGPETLRAVAVRPEQSLTAAPGAAVRLTVPLADVEPSDPRRGVPVAAERLPTLFRAAQERLGALHDRARMFDLWLDDRGRVVRMHHHFSP
ncbi:hypothetical protein DFJ69_6696 [Thermomonospora umbrina]|uniref:Uncharacterized protein n=2 Tax=Thermomonospora umbrina TaxID=111806 RepID=A0A3D9SYS5_9ACTN|nr:hypothetical protein DFJ69_6696 [Thermomonospora umbrina]